MWLPTTGFGLYARRRKPSSSPVWLSCPLILFGAELRYGDGEAVLSREPSSGLST